MCYARSELPDRGELRVLQHGALRLTALVLEIIKCICHMVERGMGLAQLGCTGRHQARLTSAPGKRRQVLGQDGHRPCDLSGRDLGQQQADAEGQQADSPHHVVCVPEGCGVA